MQELIKNNIVDLCNSLEKLTVLFYQRNNDEGMKELNPILNQIFNVTEELTYLKTQNEKLTIDINKINECLNSALNALQQKDTIMFSDVLRFELMPELEDIKRIL